MAMVCQPSFEDAAADFTRSCSESEPFSILDSKRAMARAGLGHGLLPFVVHARTSLKQKIPNASRCLGQHPHRLFPRPVE